MLNTRGRELGARLKAARHDAQLTTRELADKVGVNASHITRMENGQIAAPSAEVLSRMAVALNLSLASIFDAAGYPMHRDLPQLVPYLREMYPELPEPAVREMERYLKRISKTHGLGGPSAREDES